MSDLSKALAAVRESAPERPDYLFGSLPTTDYTVAIESLALRLAVRLAGINRGRSPFNCADAEGAFCGYCGSRKPVDAIGDDEADDTCPACDGCGDPDNDHHNPIPCHLCGGTGKEQPR